MLHDTVAIVPAGGQSRRLGERVGPGGKAALVVAGESLLGRVCRVLAAEVARVIVVAPAGRPLPPLPPGIDVVPDREQGRGPLAAIRDGLAAVAARGEPVPRRALLVACDLPRLSSEIVRRLLDHEPAPGTRWLVPLVAGEPQPLLSVLSLDLAAVLEATLAADRRSLRGALAAVAESDPKAVAVCDAAVLFGTEADLAVFADIDTPDDLSACDVRVEPG